MSDSSKDKDKNAQKQKDMQGAYQKGVKDGSKVHYSEGSDRGHIDSFGEGMKN